MLSCYTGIPVRNKTRDAAFNLLPQYWTVRYLRNGQVTGDYHLELRHAVEDDVEANAGIVGLERVEWRGNHIGEEWRDVTEWYRNAYHERTNDNED